MLPSDYTNSVTDGDICKRVVFVYNHRCFDSPFFLSFLIFLEKAIDVLALLEQCQTVNALSYLTMMANPTALPTTQQQKAAAAAAAAAMIGVSRM